MRQSPLNSAQKIKTPLLVVQGANDPRVKKAESEQIVIALRDRGFPVEYILAPDEGHGFARPVNNMALWAASREVLRQAPRRTLPGGRDARGRHPAEGDHGRPEDGRALEGGRRGARSGVPKVAVPAGLPAARATRGRSRPAGRRSRCRSRRRSRRRTGPGSSPTPRRCRWATRSTSRRSTRRPSSRASARSSRGRRRSSSSSRAARPRARWPWAASRSRCRSTSAASCSPTARAPTRRSRALPLAEGYQHDLPQLRRAAAEGRS